MTLAVRTLDGPSHLCDLCQEICQSLFGSAGGQPSASQDTGNTSAPAYKSEGNLPLQHYQTFGELRDNFKTGCHLCSLLWRCVGFSGLADGVALVAASYSIHYSPSHARLELCLDVREGSDPSGTLDLWSGRIPAHVRSTAEKYSDSLSADSTGSPACFGLASTWLHHCLANHPNCSVQDEEPTKLPSRLLHLTATDEGPLVHLCSNEPGEDEDDEIQYLTLSHCWGTEKVLTLTKASLEPFLVNISLDVIAPTFVDAVRITLKLGFAYLWIDSLCIIQDDEEDWNRESANMGNIYRNGVCNIAALGARSDREGCFAERAVLGFLPLEIELNGKCVHFEPPPFSQNWGVGSGTRDQAPLMDRAWVLQEVTLSPRTIYYGVEQLFWDCIDVAAFECEPGMFHQLPSRSEIRRGNKNIFDDPLNVVQPDIQSSTGVSTWDRLIHDYTGAKLTRQSDRWLAIAGLANKLSVMTGLSIVAGMWRETLGDDLLWHASTPGINIPNGSPSWSWLSLDALVCWTREQSHERAMEVLVMPEGSDHISWQTVSNEGFSGVVESSGMLDPARLEKYHPLVVKGRLRQFFADATSITSPGYTMIRTELYRDSGPWQFEMQLFGMLYSHDFPLNHISVLLIVPADDFGVAWKRVGVLRADLEEGNIYNELSRHADGAMLEHFGPENTICII